MPPIQRCAGPKIPAHSFATVAKRDARDTLKRFIQIARNPVPKRYLICGMLVGPETRNEGQALQLFRKNPATDAATLGEAEEMSGLRVLVPMTDTEIETMFVRLGYRVRIDELVFTAETIDDFWFARYEAWDDPGAVARREPGLLIVKGARPRKSSQPRDVVVVGFVMVRVVLGIDRQESDFIDLPEMPVARTLLLATAPKRSRLTDALPGDPRIIHAALIELGRDLVRPFAPVGILAHLKRPVLGVAVILVERKLDRLIEHQQAMRRKVMNIHYAPVQLNDVTHVSASMHVCTSFHPEKFSRRIWQPHALSTAKSWQIRCFGFCLTTRRIRLSPWPTFAFRNGARLEAAVPSGRRLG